LAAEIKKKYKDANIVFIAGSGGVFEVTRDGKLIFSKKELGRFPETDEILG